MFGLFEILLCSYGSGITVVCISACDFLVSRGMDMGDMLSLWFIFNVLYSCDAAVPEPAFCLGEVSCNLRRVSKPRTQAVIMILPEI